MSHDTLENSTRRRNASTMQITAGTLQPDKRYGTFAGNGHMLQLVGDLFKDKTNWTAADFMLSFCTLASICPDGYAIPFLKSVQSDLVSLTLRTVSANAPGIFYAAGRATMISASTLMSSRTYNPMERGRFWPLQNALAVLQRAGGHGYRVTCMSRLIS